MREYGEKTLKWCRKEKSGLSFSVAFTILSLNPITQNQKLTWEIDIKDKVLKVERITGINRETEK
jgi:hypothetical protein